MAEFPIVKYLKLTTDAAIKLLDARSRLATAQDDVVSAEAELGRLTGDHTRIDFQLSESYRYFECDGDPKVRLEYSDDTTNLSEAKCLMVVKIWRWEEDKAPKTRHLCGSCASAELRRDGPRVESVEEKKAKTEEVAF